jgi:Helicase HerA, central domain
MRTMSLHIEERIRNIVRADYDDAAHPDLSERQLLPQNDFFKITELARFWDDPKTGGESLAKRQQRLITSLYGIRIPWTYVVLGDGGVASVFIGLPCRDGEARSWEQRLTAQLPGSSWQMERPSQKVLATLADFPIVAAISGNPSISDSDDQQTDSDSRSPGLESLFETMVGVRWAYMVLVLPLTDQELARDLQMTEAELQETNSAYRRRGSVEENNNQLVTRYVALLESAHKKLLQGQRHGMWYVQSYLMTDTLTDCQRGAQALHAVLGGPGSEPQPLRIKAGSRNGSKDFGTRMITRLNTSEVAVLASLPQREVAGLQVTDYVAFGMAGGVSGHSDIALGTVMSGGTCTSLWFEIQKDSLSKHMFVAGVPGSGKTRTCLYLLSQLWREHQIPWLVLEPSMKSEYRALLRSSIGSELRVFTAGDESVAPLRLNPLEVPSGVHVQTHIGGLATLFRAAFAMEAPMPYVLDEAIHRVYEDRGWDLVSGTHPSFSPESQPTLGDLLETCNKVVYDLGYENQLKGNLQAALRTRLSSLMRGAKGRMLNVRQSVSMEYLLSAPTVIEFSAIGDDDEKAFLLGCILLKLAQHRQTEGLAAAGLRHITLIEEAHRLLRKVPETAGTSVANPRCQAVEAFSNMLAELRAFGEGLVVVDQMPSKLVPDVIRNSGLKLVHRLTAEEERTIVGGAMSLNEAQTRFLSSLPVGQAIVYSDGSANACRICVPDHAGHEGYLGDSPSQAKVRAHMQGRIPQSVDQRAHASAVTTAAPNGNILLGCMVTCPASSCTVLTAVDGYLTRHTEEIEASFKKAIAEGFEALWQFGLRVANTLWPEGGRRDDSSFCVVMAVASKTGMAEQDMQVLRRNMTRLWKEQRKGILS